MTIVDFLQYADTPILRYLLSSPMHPSASAPMLILHLAHAPMRPCFYSPFPRFSHSPIRSEGTRSFLRVSASPCQTNVYDFFSASPCLRTSASALFRDLLYQVLNNEGHFILSGGVVTHMAVFNDSIGADDHLQRNGARQAIQLGSNF